MNIRWNNWNLIWNKTSIFCFNQFPCYWGALYFTYVRTAVFMPYPIILSIIRLFVQYLIHDKPEKQITNALQTFCTWNPLVTDRSPTKKKCSKYFMAVFWLGSLTYSNAFSKLLDIHGTTWWRHQMETFSALLAIYAGNWPVPGEFPAQRSVTRSFDIFSDLRWING